SLLYTMFALRFIMYIEVHYIYSVHLIIHIVNMFCHRSHSAVFCHHSHSAVFCHRSHSTVFSHSSHSTVLHDFFTYFGRTKIFVKKMPEGYGLVCHRAIRTICQTLGIKDIHAKIEGPTNVQNITKAFFLGLIRQHIMDGKVQLVKKKYPAPYEKLPSYEIYLKKYARRRNHQKVMLNMLVEEGEYRSFYTDQYPECRPGYSSKSEEAEAW
ncbi:hypothetical protein OTU49_005515, partial [Cherax quadricarinatus]